MNMTGKMKKAFWQDVTLRQVSQNGRFLALYLLNCPHGNSLGVFQLTEAYALADLQWDGPVLMAALEELKGIGFLDYSTGGLWISLLSYQQFSPAANGKQLEGRIRQLERLPVLDLTIEPIVRLLKLSAHAYFVDDKRHISRIDAVHMRYNRTQQGMTLP